MLESSPTVIDGVVYCGTFADHLYALDAMTGEERMREHVNKFNYGNRDLSGGIRDFWLQSSLKIS